MRSVTASVGINKSSKKVHQQERVISIKIRVVIMGPFYEILRFMNQMCQDQKQQKQLGCTEACIEEHCWLKIITTKHCSPVENVQCWHNTSLARGTVMKWKWKIGIDSVPGTCSLFIEKQYFKCQFAVSSPSKRNVNDGQINNCFLFL